LLVLTRRDKEGIVLNLPSGEEVRIFVEVAGANKAKLVVDAPQDVRVGRLSKSGVASGSRGVSAARTYSERKTWKTRNTSR
jgi:hypothetical protein